MFQIVRRFCHRAFEVADEVHTTYGLATQTDDDIPLGVVVGDGQDLAIGLEAMRGALDHLIGRLAGAREQDLHVAS